VIRISGADSFAIVEKIFRGKKPLDDCESHTIHYGDICSKDGDTLDDVLLLLFRAPHTYTGEDVIEISTHGNPLITKKVLAALLEQGVRLAEPGEFTRRAFLNNRIDLMQAEAVIDIINARTEVSLRGARNQLDGLLSKEVSKLRESLLQTASLLELELDFAEEDVQFVDRTAMTQKMNAIINGLQELLDTYKFGRVIRDGVNAAIVGQPNVGKSSLLNYILKESRAIVSEIPGTTRDIIREEVSIDGILFRLYDTAGIRFTEDTIEKEGVQRSRNAVTNADLVILVNDVEQPFAKDLYDEILALVPAEKIISVLNKIDKKNFPSTEFRNSASAEITEQIQPDVLICALDGTGIAKLLDVMKERALGSAVYTERTAIVSSLRHHQFLTEAKEHLEKAREAAAESLSAEYVAAYIRSATNALSEIIGVITDDDILNHIFSKFCIGK
jgi:tRNA modification GTPase